ncbi:hypothetical protein GGR54DRAFT_60177 [Hypoxylon sp. NC1633]|nr:hypothetical protein GGR54DRAFT_60177 [Hypoxylon sp. NC1633]
MTFSSGAIGVIAIGFISYPLSVMALGLRIWSRTIQQTSLAFNDYAAVAATVFAAGDVSSSLAAAFIGATGTHAVDIIDPWVLETFFMLLVPNQLFWGAANTGVKLSILSLYTLMFPSKRFRYFCYGAMAISVAYFISVVLGAFLLCRPIDFNWNKDIDEGSCGNQTMLFLSSAITNMVIDAFIVALPMPMLFGLKMPLAKRFSIAIMFSLGGL